MDAGHENTALEQAAVRIAETDSIERRIHESSISLLAEQAAMVKEALILLDAATIIGIQPDTVDSRERAIKILSSTLQHLIRHGWNGVLVGHYPGAMQSLRLIGEMSDHMAACRFSEPGAQLLLESQEWKLRAALKLLERELIKIDPRGAAAWSKRRLHFRNGIQAVAHTSGLLMRTACHYNRDRQTLDLGLNLNVRTACTIAYLYAEAGVYAMTSIGTALNDYLPDEGPFTARQRALLERWNQFQEANPPEFVTRPGG